LKILFDEGVPRQLRELLQGRDITLVRDQGWTGIKNGRLLQLAEETGFDVLITSDQQLKYQQNLKGREIAIVVLPYNRRKWMALLLPGLTTTLDKIGPGDYVELPRPAELPS
jgi:hypothetical protein